MKIFAGLMWAFAFPALLPAESWPVSGTIAGVLPERESIVLRHEGIPDFSAEPGEVEATVGPGDLAIARVDQSIRGQLTRQQDELLLQAIWPSDKQAEQAMTLINRDMMRPRIGASKGRLRVGDEFPRFALYNQMGLLVKPGDLDNRVLVATFVFTRSKVPTMSAATVKRMAELQDRLAESGMLDEVKLLSLSLDPEYDTPGRCYTYLDARGVNHDSYWMLTGSTKALDYLTGKIGVVSVPSQKTILNHSMLLLVVDKERKIFHRIAGTRWSLEEVYDRLEVLLRNWN